MVSSKVVSSLSIIGRVMVILLVLLIARRCYNGLTGAARGNQKFGDEISQFSMENICFSRFFSKKKIKTNSKRIKCKWLNSYFIFRPK